MSNVADAPAAKDKNAARPSTQENSVTEDPKSKYVVGAQRWAIYGILGDPGGEQPLALQIVQSPDQKDSHSQAADGVPEIEIRMTHQQAVELGKFLVEMGKKHAQT